MREEGIAIFSGNSNPNLSAKICEYLDIRLGAAKVSTFSDGEIQVEIHDNVRGKDVFENWGAFTAVFLNIEK